MSINLGAERASRRSFRATDVIAAAGITYRQLDYWTRTDLVQASGHASTGHGDARWYRDTDVIRIATISALLNAGISYASIRDNLDVILEDGTVRHDGVTITVDVDAIRQRINTFRRRAS